MGYVVVLDMDGHQEVKVCQTDDERDAQIEQWTKSLTRTYWGRNRAKITVYPDTVLQEVDFEVDHSRSKVNNVFKITSII